MMTIDIALPPMHQAQAHVFNNLARFNVLVTGRRWGKTMFGVGLCVHTALQGGRVWWIAPSYPMTRVGWRMLQHLTIQIPGVEINKADRIVTLPGGGSIQVRSGHEPFALRGDGLDFAVLDEAAYMKPEVWTEAIRPALSDRRGRALFISTPKGGNWYGDLYKYAKDRQDDTWRAFQYKSVSNPYLDPNEIISARDVQSDRLFRQEYEAEILTDVPGALWQRNNIDQHRMDTAPDMTRIAVAIDPAVTAGDESDETGIVVAGCDDDRDFKRGYTLADGSMKGTPAQWARRAIALYYRYEADIIVAEVNNGGDMVEHTIRMEDSSVHVKQVRATRGKYTRAEPVSALYEKGQISHVGYFPELEDQMCTWLPGDKSPDRLDALVWCFTELMLGKQIRLDFA
jgi:phage terminase large subunit-like protein